MDNKNVALLVGAFVSIIIGVSLLTVISSEEQAVVAKTSVFNETLDFQVCMTENENPTINNTGCNLTVANAPTGWKLQNDDSCPLTTIVLRNGTADTLTVTTDYVASAATGIIELKNTSAVYNGLALPSENETYVDYLYCPDDYINASWARSVSDIIPGFFAIALLALGVGLFFAVMKNEGLTGI